MSGSELHEAFVFLYLLSQVEWTVHAHSRRSEGPICIAPPPHHRLMTPSPMCPSIATGFKLQTHRPEVLVRRRFVGRLHRCGRAYTHPLAQTHQRSGPAKRARSRNNTQAEKMWVARHKPPRAG
eukprot:1931941-Rhodomonas_salina.2